MVDVTTYGAVGDGFANDTMAIQAAITQAQSQGAAVFFPHGKYRIPSLAAQSGRLILVGFGDATIIGNFSYHQPSFPLSADTPSPPTEDSPFFSAHGLNFKTVNDDYALTISTQVQGGFIATAEIGHCRFYGRYGLRTQNLITFHIESCWFHATNTGWRAEGCTNGSVIASKWHNQKSFGVLITSYDPDPAREGGENIRFSNCEWAVCSYGIYVERHNWLVMNDCLLDFCGLPLGLVGSNTAKAVNTYFGASDNPQSQFNGSQDFTAVFSRGISLYARPYAISSDRSSVRTTGGSFENCEFVNYTNNEQPPVYFEGSASVAYVQPSWDNERRAEKIQFNDCLFLMPGDHNAETLLQISNSTIVGVFNNRFQAFKNSSNTIQAAYRFNKCLAARGMNNDFTYCRSSAGAIVGSPHESSPVWRWPWLPRA